MSDSLAEKVAHAVVGLSLSLRFEGADLGVKVSAVCPGYVRTPIFENAVMVNLSRELTAFPKRVKVLEAAQAAQVIMDGVARNQALIAFPGYIRLARRAYRLFPRLVERGIPRQVREARGYRTAASL
jgi:short-subunit dehydrogenase